MRYYKPTRSQDYFSPIGPTPIGGSEFSEEKTQSTRRFLFGGTISLIAILNSGLMQGQDSRKVVHPRVPAACAILEAKIAATDGVLGDESEHALDTNRIQRAIDSCTYGKAVVLRGSGRKQVFLSGPIQLRSGVTLVVSANTALVGSRDPRLYDRAPGSCGILSERNNRSPGCKALISGDAIEDSAVMGEGSIDGRGGAKLLGEDETWWDLAYQGKVKDKPQSVFDLITVRRAKNFTLYGITLRNAPGTHVGVGETDGFTAWGVKIMTPHAARNTDGIDPGSSRNVTIAYCSINNGDDNVTIGSGGGVPAANISVLHNHFYAGHGMSIGSGTAGGIMHMLVDDLTIDGADNGIRIKSDRSRGGLVFDITYRNICMRDVNNPLAFTPSYSDRTGDLLPVYQDIILENIHILTHGTYTFQGLDEQHKLGITLNDVFADDLEHSTISAKDADFTVGRVAGNLKPTGIDVSMHRAAASSAGRPIDCKARFTAFPALARAPEMAGQPPPVDQNPYVGPGAK
jgi:polygalacturonase